MDNAGPDTVRQTDLIDPDRAIALMATLGLDARVSPGDPLPPFFHQIYFWSPHPPARLGRDGHPGVGQGLVPDMGLPRRMWAGGRLVFHTPLRAGIPAEKFSALEQVEQKTGRSGPLAFVRLKHEIIQEGKICITDWQDLVYREDPDPKVQQPTPPKAPERADSVRAVSFSTTTLFRYSALTFNGHRIHYDRDYATQTEGYSGLVVHGPLLAQLLMIFAEDELGPLKGFSFRGTSALMDTETATLCRRQTGLWVRGPDGRQCMTAEVEV